MNKYLIVGLPGIGKSTVIAELSKRGFTAFDADDLPELSMWKHRISGETTRHRDHDRQDWNEHYDWAWSEQALAKILDSTPQGPLFLAGNAANVSEFYSRFDKVFALTGSDDLLRNRIKQRDSGYGFFNDELQAVLAWNKDFADTERTRGAVLIDASPDIKQVVSNILELCDEDTPVAS